MEMEEVERQHVVNMKANAERKGKAKAHSTSWEEQLRYKEAVEEKKGESSISISNLVAYPPQSFGSTDNESSLPSISVNLRTVIASSPFDRTSCSP
jgi:hypothetical protein